MSELNGMINRQIRASHDKTGRLNHYDVSVNGENIGKIMSMDEGVFCYFSERQHLIRGDDFIWVGLMLNELNA